MADSENIDITILKCNDREQILSKQLLKFYEDSELFDIILVAGKDCVNIKAHRVVLCAFSEYFLEVFREKRSQNDDQKLVPDNTIELKQFEASTLEDVVEFMYTGTIELCLNTAEKFLRIAVDLKIPTLINNCSGFIEERLNNVNSLSWLKIANELCLPSLKTGTLEYIYMEFENLSEDDFFLKMLNVNELEDLLFRENPYGDFEEDIFLAMVAWINYDKPNRENMIFELLSLVRFWKLTPKFIIENRHSVCKTMESYELICSWIEFHLSPETNLRQPKPTIIPLKERVLPMTNGLGFIGMENDEIVTCRFDHIKNEVPPEKKDELPSEIVKPSTVKINNNKLLFYDLLSKTINIFDWEFLMELSELPTIEEHSSFQLLEINGNPHAVKNAVLYSVDLDSGEWDQLTDFKSAEKSGKLVINAHNSMLYVYEAIKGRLHRFDVSSPEWISVNITKKNNEIINYQSFVATEKVLYFFNENTVHRFNLLSMEWDKDISLPKINSSNIKCYSYNEDVIISDGTKVEKLSADSGEWTTLAQLPPKLSKIGFSIFKFTNSASTLD